MKVMAARVLSAKTCMPSALNAVATANQGAYWVRIPAIELTRPGAKNPSLRDMLSLPADHPFGNVSISIGRFFTLSKLIVTCASGSEKRKLLAMSTSVTRCAEQPSRRHSRLSR